MGNILYNSIIFDVSQELSPSIRISPFNNEYLITKESDQQKVHDYLNDRFKKFYFLKKGRDAISVALSYYNLAKDDVVTILTTSNNFYISGCVTKEIEKFCKWNRKITDKTKVIFFNHEFGYPGNVKELSKYNIPIIEDCAHSFFSYDDTIGKYSDFVIYSLPKAFPMQMGAILKTDKLVNIETADDTKQYILNNLSNNIDKLEEMRKKRIEIYQYFQDELKNIGISPFFPLKDNVIPGVFLFKWYDCINYADLKTFMQDNGVESSVFYGKNAFFLPCHQNLKDSEIYYIINLLKYFNANLV